jgi:pimeloyl-ACP methyl ester carboxylesterase
MADQLSPSSALHSTIESSAGPLAALIGSPDSVAGAPVLLLVPGYTGSKEDFAPIMDPLVGAGYVAIAIDQPGQFESPGPEDEDQYSPAALGQVLASVVGRLALDRQVVVLGHSFGGLVARAAVLAGAPIGGLILLCSGPAAFTEGNRFDVLTTTGPILREHGVEALLEGDDPDPLAQFLRKRSLASSRAALLGMGAALLTEPDRTADLAEALAAAAIPVAVVAGQGDDAWPLQTQREMARALHTQLVLVPGGAHSPAVEAPDNLLAILLPLMREWVSRRVSATNPTTGPPSPPG